MSVRAVPWWGVVSSAAPPVVLAAGWTVAAFLQSRPYDPAADTVSALAGIGATDRWVMTLAFALAGACEIVTGLAPRPARPAGRLVLMTGGTAGILVAASPVRMLAGLAERVLGEAQSGWPFVTVMSCRHPLTVTTRYRLLRGYG
jgi:Protein of unknown function (DUF998)